MAGTDEPFSFDEPLEWRLRGDASTVQTILMRLGQEFEWEAHTFKLARDPQGVLGLAAQLPGGQDLGLIGAIFVDDLPGSRTRFRIPRNRGHHDFPNDPEGRLFSRFLTAALEELRALGFMSTSSRFESHRILDTATRELEAAEELEAFAAIGNIMLSSLLALAHELYAEHMLPDAADTPKKDDAKRKLRCVINHYFAGRSENYRKGLIRSAEGTWDAVSALKHRKRAQREEAEICLALVSAQFEVFSLMVPEG